MQPRSQVMAVVMASAPILLVAALFVAGAILFNNAIAPGKDFGPFQERIAIVESQMHFSQTTNGNYISTIGQIRNESGFAWKNFQLEVRYYNREERMIDTRSEKLFQTLPAGATHAFRIRAPADKPELLYAGHKIFVRGAEDARRWP